MKKHLIKDKEIPVFFAVDENYASFLAVAIKSIQDNSSRDYHYSIYILHDGLNKETIATIKGYQDENYTIEFVDVKLKVLMLANKLHTRDYYTRSTYYRLFIQRLFPNIDKALYLDSDIIVLGDLSQLYNHELGNNLVCAGNEDVMQNTPVFGEYVEKVLGIDRNKFFNAGVLVMNLKLFRKEKIEKQFIKLISNFKFSVTQDEDYLNVLCKDRITYFDRGWNLFPAIEYDENKIKLIHYKMSLKPWHYDGIRYGDYFWKYAKQTDFYPALRFIKDNFSTEDKKKDDDCYQKLVDLARAEIAKEDTYLNWLKKQNKFKKKDNGRLAVIQKIKELEEQGVYDVDVENDPPTIPLVPDKVDYLGEKLTSRIKTYFVNAFAKRYIDKLIKKRQLIIKEIKGIEYLENLNEGAVITCNHFNAFDNFAIQKAFEISGQMKKRKLFKVIREGNYTSFKGMYGVFFRNCNTLPLSSVMATMKKFLFAVDTILQRGDYVLIYPEQAMWWNYKKVRPFKIGAFNLASRSSAPILPVFISFNDSDKMGKDGYYIQEYTLNIMPPIYPDKTKSQKESAEEMRSIAQAMYQDKYKEVYGE